MILVGHLALLGGGMKMMVTDYSFSHEVSAFVSVAVIAANLHLLYPQIRLTASPASTEGEGPGLSANATDLRRRASKGDSDTVSF